jgi:hypothetical protein
LVGAANLAAPPVLSHPDGICVAPSYRTLISIRVRRFRRPFPARCSRPSLQLPFDARFDASQAALRAIASFPRVVEIGARRGYWYARACACAASRW